MVDFLHAIGMADTFWQLPTILARLIVAAIFGAIIGFERETSLKSAGLRTHTLIALAAALYTILTLEIFHLPEVMTNGRSDPVHEMPDPSSRPQSCGDSSVHGAYPQPPYR